MERHRQGAEGARALGVHATFGDHLAREMREFLEMPDVLQQYRPVRARRHDVLVVSNSQLKR